MGGVLVTVPEPYYRIETAIREQALSIPDGFAHFVKFTYGGMSTDTFAINELPPKAAELADRLVALNAEIHMIGGRESPWPCSDLRSKTPSMLWTTDCPTCPKRIQRCVQQSR